ncbi:unnamed protein product [Diamesa hyperborea]
MRHSSEDFNRRKRSNSDSSSSSSDSDDSNYKPRKRNCVEMIETKKLNPLFEGHIDHYSKIEKIGEGTFGKVYKARDEKTLELVALKHIRCDYHTEEIKLSRIDEIKILSKLKHKNIVVLKKAFTDYESNSYYLSFEYMDFDLMELLEFGKVFSDQTNANIMKQILDGINYCHGMKYLHRDIKTSNILVNRQGIVKIADFGLAIRSDSAKPFDNHVVTLWYRSPELLLGEVMYDESIDVWSLGCVLGELFAKDPLFPGNNEECQLNLISSLCGIPTEEDCPSFKILPFFKTRIPKVNYKRIVRSEFAHLPPHALDLLDNMLTLDPYERITVQEALRSPWFKNVNPDELLLNLPKMNFFYKRFDSDDESD